MSWSQVYDPFGNQVLSTVTGLDLQALSSMVGRQLPFFSVLVPFWLIWAFVGFRRMIEIWPAIPVAGVAFAVPQFLVSNYHGPWLVDVIAAISSMGALALFLRVWHPKEVRTSTSREGATVPYAQAEAKPTPEAAVYVLNWLSAVVR